MAQSAFDEALQFARKKMQRTSPSTDVQSIQHDIAEMASELEAMKVLAYSTAWKEAQGLNPIRETSMTKYFCAETAKRIIMKGMNVLGENGASDGLRYAEKPEGNSYFFHRRRNLANPEEHYLQDLWALNVFEGSWKT
ncbi:MAG: hypothetical protein MZV70_38105 [Desulfobacterales bacterium]|nr:hypothetical protein [Desulfobacterales bacterium]